MMPTVETKEQSPGAAFVRPIVLEIGAEGKAIIGDGRMLTALYGDLAPERCYIEDELRIDEHNRINIFCPFLGNDKYLLRMLRYFDDVPLRKMVNGFCESDEFYETVYRFILDQANIFEGDADRVRLISADKPLFEEQNPLRHVAQKFFPQAVLFETSDSGPPMELFRSSES